MRKIQRRSLLPALLLLVLGAGIHIPFISGAPLWDDGAFISGNSFLSDCSGVISSLSPESFVKVERRKLAARPLTLATLAADACQGGDLAWLKLTNAFLHGLNASLLFFYISAAGGGGAAAFLAAGLFALHPAAGEVVHIAVFRNHLLSFLFVFCALTLLLDESGPGRWKRETGALLCFTAALLSGETAAAFPFMLLCQWAAAGRPLLDARRLRLLAGSAGILFFYLWFRLPRSGYALPGAEPLVTGILAPLYPASMFPPPGTACYAPPNWIPPWSSVYSDAADRVYTMSGVLLSYARDLFFPLSLKGDYSPRVLTAAAEGLPRAALLATMLAAPAAMLASARARNAGAALLMAIAAFLPVSGLFPLYNLQADRYLYLPLGAAALFLVRAAAIPRTPAGIKAAAAALAGACVLFAYLSLDRLPAFSSPRAFFEAAAEGTGNPRAEINLSAISAAAGDYGEAESRLEAAIRLYPSDPHASIRLAETRLKLRRADEAMRALEITPLPPGLAPAGLYIRGAASWQKGRPAEAAKLFREAEAAAGGCFHQARIAGKAAGLLAGETSELTLAGEDACAAPTLLRSLAEAGARPSPAGLADKIEEKNLSGPCRN